MNFKAFSLFEILVVLTIIGILSSIAMPAYNDYIIKARILQLVNIADSYKIQLFEDILAGELSKKRYNLQLKGVDYVAIDNTSSNQSTFIIQVYAQMKTKEHSGIGLVQPNTTKEPLSIQMQGQEENGIINWTCHVAKEYNKYVPSSCRNNNIVSMNLG